MSRANTRDHIVSVASDLFYQNGFNLTGINEIIKEADIAKATLYNHFASKDEICIAYLETMHEQFMTDLQAFYTARKSRKQQVLILFDFLKLAFDQETFNGCWCINIHSEIPKEKLDIKALIKRQKSELISFIETVIRSEEKKRSVAESQKLAKQIYLLYEAAVTESHLHQDAWPIQNAKDICKLILK